tara:strand:- start:92 stop:373 length:282 start_codon:yes stop_codon:yes gene_type:complete
MHTVTVNRLEENNIEQDIWYDELIKLGELWGKPNVTALADEVEELEQQRIHDALQMSNGNKTHAASYLGIGRTLLLHKIKKYHIQETANADTN